MGDICLDTVRICEKMKVTENYGKQEKLQEHEPKGSFSEPQKFLGLD